MTWLLWLFVGPPLLVLVVGFWGLVIAWVLGFLALGRDT